jgi:hypothetical protein
MSLAALSTELDEHVQLWLQEKPVRFVPQSSWDYIGEFESFMSRNVNRIVPVPWK